MSKNLLLKLVSMLLVTVMVGVMIVACDGTGAGGTSTSGAKTDNLDLPQLNFKGNTVTFLYGIEDGDPLLAPMSVESINNDPLNDAIFNREYRVNDRLGVKLKFIQDADATEKARLAVDSVLDEYQIVGAPYSEIIIYGKDGYYNNFLDKELNPYVDLTEPYWSQLFTDAATMYGQCYFATGSLSLTYTKSITSMFYNKDMVKNAGVENLYKVINDGDWTYDYMLNLIKGSYIDVTGNGKTNDDVYGLVMDDARIVDAFWSAFDISCMSRDSDGNPVFGFDNGKMEAVIAAVRSMQKENRDIFCIDSVKAEESGEEGTTKLEKFSRDEAMFTISYIYVTEQKVMRDMKSTYGIIPLPKWDDAQDDYYSFNNAFAAYGIPTTVAKVDMATAVLEALAGYSYDSVAPTYYDRVLNGQYTRDLESSAMLDLMVANVKMDFGWIYDTDMKKIAQESFRYLIRSGDTTFGRFWAQNKKLYGKAFDNLIAAYQKRAEA